MGDYRLQFAPRHTTNPGNRRWLRPDGDIVSLPTSDFSMADYLAKGFRLLDADDKPVEMPVEAMPAQTMRFRATAAEIELSATAARVAAARALMARKGKVGAGVGEADVAEAGSGGVFAALPLSDPHGLPGVAIEPPGLVSYGLHTISDEDVERLSADPGFMKLVEDMEAGKNPVLAKAVAAQEKLDANPQAVNAARASGKTVTTENLEEVTAEAAPAEAPAPTPPSRGSTSRASNGG